MKLEFTVDLTIKNVETGKVYTITATRTPKEDEPREALVNDLIDQLLDTVMTKEMREVEGCLW